MSDYFNLIKKEQEYNYRELKEECKTCDGYDKNKKCYYPLIEEPKCVYLTIKQKST